MAPRDLFQEAGIPDPNSTGQLAARNAGVNGIPPNNPPPIPVAPPAVPQNAEADIAPASPMPVSRAAMSSPTLGRDLFEESAANAARVPANTAVSSAAGHPVDTNSGLGDISPWMRARTDTMNSSEDRAKYLNENMQGSDARVVDVPGYGKMTVFTDPKTGVSHPIVPSQTTIGGATGAAWGAAPAVGAQVATSLIPGLRAMGPLGRMFFQALSGAAENTAGNTINKAEGYNSQSAGSMAGDAATSGATSALGELFGSLLSKGVKAASGTDKGLLKLYPQEAEALSAQKELGAPGYSLDQLRPEGFGARGSYLRDLSPYLENSVDRPQRQFLASKLAGGGASLTNSDLDNFLAGLKTEAESKIDNPNVPASQGGRALQTSVNQELKPALSERTSAAYDEALDPRHNGVYDLSKPNSVAAAMEKGISAQGRPITKVESVPVDNGYGIGAPATTESATTEIPTVQVGGLSPELKGPVRDLQKLNPQLGTETTTNTSAGKPLQSIRSRLAYSASEPGETPQSKAAYKQARELLPALDESIANPVSGNPELGNLTRNARNKAAFQNKVLDAPVMKDISSSSSPEDLVAKYAGPGNFTNNQLIKRTVKPEAFAKYQDAYVTKLANSPESIQAELKALNADDPRNAKLLLPADKQAQLLEYSNALDDIKKSLPAKLRALPGEADRPVQALALSDGTELKDFIDQVGGPQSAMGQNVRKGIRQSILDSSVDPKTGQADPMAIARNTGKLLESGRLKGVLTPAEVNELQNIRVYANQISRGGKGMGASLASSEVAQGASNWIRPIKMLKAWAEGAFAGVQSRTFARPGVGRAIFAPEGALPSNATRAPAVGGAAYENQQRDQENAAPANNQ